MSDRAYKLLACAVGLLGGFWFGIASGQWPVLGWAVWCVGCGVAFGLLRLWLEPPR